MTEFLYHMIMTMRLVVHDMMKLLEGKMIMMKLLEGETMMMIRLAKGGMMMMMTMMIRLAKGGMMMMMMMIRLAKGGMMMMMIRLAKGGMMMMMIRLAKGGMMMMMIRLAKGGMMTMMTMMIKMEGERKKFVEMLVPHKPSEDCQKKRMQLLRKMSCPFFFFWRAVALDWHSVRQRSKFWTLSLFLPSRQPSNSQIRLLLS